MKVRTTQRTHSNRAFYAGCYRQWVAALACCVAYAPAWAGFIVGQTRVVYPQGSRSQRLLVGNVGEQTTAFQAWIDNGQEGPHDSTAPFVITPPVVLLQSGARSMLNIVHTGLASVPADRESLFWINLLEVPPVPETTPDDLRLNVALNMQLKLIYRPSALTYDFAAIARQLRFSQRREGSSNFVVVENPSPFIVSFAHWELRLSDGQAVPLPTQDLTIGPFTGRMMPWPGKSLRGVTQVRALMIDDHGTHRKLDFDVR